MSQKYIDFVPSKKPSSGKAILRAVGQTTKSHKVQPRISSQVKKGKDREAPYVRSEQMTESMTAKAATRTSAFSIKKEPAYGVIEDFHPKFVKAEVEKRPLSKGHFGVSNSELSELKSRKIERGVSDVFEKKNESNRGVVDSKKTLAIPKTPFIAKAKVNKRPLSKNVYKKPIQPTKEPTTGPVTIISKPESEEGKGGMVIAVILTIILGAVAGTIAFLILPK